MSVYINPIFIRNVQVLADCRNILNYSSACKSTTRLGFGERANAHGHVACVRAERKREKTGAGRK